MSDALFSNYFEDLLFLHTYFSNSCAFITMMYGGCVPFCISSLRLSLEVA